MISQTLSTPSGGLVTQLNLLGAVLRLAIAESPYIAMEYDRLIHQRVSNMARERYRDIGAVDYASILSTEQPDILRSILTAVTASNRPKQPPPLKTFPGNANASGAAPESGVPEVPVVPAKPKFGYGRYRKSMKVGKQ